MIRPFTFLTLAAACGSGLYLYTEKHRAELLDRQIAHVIHTTEATRQTTSLLRAEWEVLNNPDRLRPMAQKYLNLVPLQPTQWVQMADLGARLPPPEAPGHTDGPDDAAAVAASDTVAADVPVVAAPANPGVDETPPADAKPKPPQKPTTRLVAHAAPKRRPPVALANDDEPPLHTNPLAHSAPLALATPQPARARVVSAMARPVQAAPRPAVVTAMPSALGLRTSVPAPVPMGAE
jgi:hypothetical protein